MVHTNELDQQIENLRTLQQSYDQIAGAAEAYNVGKPQLAASISAMGVPASTEDSLSEMATKVRSIPQQVNTRTSEFEQMIAPTPYMWNVYTVATDLMKETLPSYIPSYMSEYKQRYGANSFFVGEYYRGYVSLELTGADGYLTHDGCFYTIEGEEGSRIVTRTAPDGTVTTYAAESIVHTWLNDSDDTYENRWVAFFYLNDAYSFTNTNSAICPRRVALCGTCNSLNISGECRLTDVWVIGTLNSLSGGTGGEAWNPAQVIKNYEVHAGAAIYTRAHLTSLVMPDLKMLTGRIFGIQDNNRDNPCADYIYLPKLTKLFEHSLVLLTSESYDKYNNAIENGPVIINLPKLTTCNVPICTSTIQSGRIYNKTIEVSLGSLEELNIIGTGGGRRGVQGIISAWGGNQWNALKRIYIPSLKRIVSGQIVSLDTYGRDDRFKNLIDIEVGAMKTSMNLRAWVATDVIADASKKSTLIENIKNHILAKVKDVTGGTQLVFTVSTLMYNAIAIEQIEWKGETMTLADAFLTKNWLLAGA